MHRFTVSLVACLWALTLPHGEGRADPRGKKDGMAPGNAKTAGEPNGKKTEGIGPGGGRTADGVGSSKKPASSTSGPGAATGKGRPPSSRGQPGIVKLVRGSETLEVRVFDKKQHLLPATLPQLTRFLRSKSGADHPIDARLVTLLATVSDHFGGREVNVVSGFRPYTAGQYSRHSQHNEGRAIDFSIKGIANETVRDYCRSLRNVGVGYYPNSLFVHLDVRDGNAYWVDYAAPGQAPRYRAPDGKGDDDAEGDAIASVDGGAHFGAMPSDAPRSDVARGRNIGRGGDRDPAAERGVFVTR